MKKLILSAGICIATLMGVQAQQTVATKAAPTKEQQVEKMMTSITTTCHLTSDQVTKVKPIVTECVNTRAENKEKSGGDKDKLKAANQATMKNMMTKLNTVLTADQQKELADKMKENASERAQKSSTSK